MRFSVGVSDPPQLLVVDDDVFFADFLRGKFAELGYAVAVADDAFGAMAFVLRWQKPLVVLLDLMLPRVSGEGLLRELARGPHASIIRVVLVSAHHTVEGLAKGHPMIVGRAQKPVDLGELARLVATASRAARPTG
jgi:CheY-like chemotaxis protein